MSSPRKTRTFTLAVFGALVVANAQPAVAQKTYQIYSLADKFSYPVDGLGAIAANGTLLAYAQGGNALITRDSAQPLEDPPGLFGSGYSGINASLTTAGSVYLEDGSDSVAFVRRADGTFRFLSFPSGAFPYTTGINDNGDVVGIYYDQDFIGHGFLADGKGIHSIDILGATDIQPLGINASGVVVGNYSDENYDSHSFIMDSKGITEWTIPGARFVYANCINNNGAIGGLYSDGTNGHAFVSKGGKLSNIDYQNPDAPNSITNNVGGREVVFVKFSSYPQVTSINDRGDIVGYTFDFYKATDPSIHFFYGFQKSFWGTPLP